MMKQTGLAVNQVEKKKYTLTNTTANALATRHQWHWSYSPEGVVRSVRWAVPSPTQRDDWCKQEGGARARDNGSGYRSCCLEMPETGGGGG